MVADRSGQADMINRLLERSATDDEYDAIEMSYGLNGVPKMTSSEIAQEMNITPGEVKELVKSAERKMKNEARDMMRNDELFSRRRRLLEGKPLTLRESTTSMNKHSEENRKKSIRKELR